MGLVMRKCDENTNAIRRDAATTSLAWVTCGHVVGVSCRRYSSSALNKRSKRLTAREVRVTSHKIAID